MPVDVDKEIFCLYFSQIGHSKVSGAFSNYELVDWANGVTPFRANIQHRINVFVLLDEL